MLEDILQVVHRAKARGLGTNEGAAVAETLAGQHAVLKRALQAAVFAVQVADFLGPHAHVSGGHVHVGPDVAVQGLHEALAKTHDLRVGFPGGVEIAAALATADGQAGKAVLEDLLEAQELDDAGVHVLLEPEAALVGADGPVELAAVADVGVPGAVVRHPADPEGEHPLRLHHAGQQVGLFIFRVLLDDGLQRGQNLLHRLDKLRLVGVPGLYMLDDTGKIGVHINILL